MGKGSAEVKKKKITRRQRLHRLTTLLQVCLGLYLFAFGIGTLGYADTLVTTVLGVLRVLTAAALLSALFALEKTRVLARVLIISLVLWISAVVFSAVVLPLVSGEFQWYRWIEQVLIDAVVFAALLIIRLERQ